MKARDIMTRDVVTVSSDTPVRDTAALMVAKHISGVPVLARDGTIIGMVSGTDLLHRAELGTEPERKRKWWLDFKALAREYAKAYGLRAQVVMSRCVVAVRDDADLRDVADVLDRHRFKRVPVLQGAAKWASLHAAISFAPSAKRKLARARRERLMRHCIRHCIGKSGRNPG